MTESLIDASRSELPRAPGAEPIARTLARFVCGLCYDDIPHDVKQSAKALLLDQLAVQLAGSTLPWIAPALALARLSRGARPESVIVGESERYLASEAAFVNATYGQACELDDSTFGSAGHIGTATIPAAIATGERERIDGRSLLTAIVAGYEVMYRLMAAVRPHHNTRGFHSQSIGGPFAAAAAAGRIIGLSTEQMTHALSIAGSHACGPLEFDQSGGEVKRVHAGIAARAGVNSALLASFGLTGPETIIEGKRGFCRLFSTQSDPSKITRDLGRSFNIGNAWIKQYPATGPVHTSIMAAARLRQEHGLAAADIARIRIAVAETSLLHGGGIVAPSDVIGAQFSFAYSVALRFHKGSNDLADYVNAALWRDPQILDLMRKVELEADPAAAGELLHMARMSVETHDGRTLSATESYPIGAPKNPASHAQLLAKARDLSDAALAPDEVERLIEAVERIEDATDLSVLTGLLSAAKPRALREQHR
jgi:2-methylcitrate dehydratase PrpD